VIPRRRTHNASDVWIDFIALTTMASPPPSSTILQHLLRGLAKAHRSAFMKEVSVRKNGSGDVGGRW
jgi:hypothetical protein